MRLILFVTIYLILISYPKFIEYAQGKANIDVGGGGLRAGANDINAVKAKFLSDERVVTLLDTPGFDEAKMSVADVSTMLHEWLTRQ